MGQPDREQRDGRSAALDTALVPGSRAGRSGPMPTASGNTSQRRSTSAGRSGPGGQDTAGTRSAAERPYDPRREARRQLARVALPDEVQPHDLDRDVRKELLSLSKETADLVARHLVMAGRLMDDDPQAALSHARAARALAGRIGAVREAAGLVAYAAGEWPEALSELRAARRITGEADHLPVMADCERALGRPERALIVAEDPQVSGLSPAARVEMLIVVSGARRDLGQADAAVVTLQVSALDAPPLRPWTARLRYAYADALLEAGRDDEARDWFARTVDADDDGQTDAEDRLLALDGVVFEDLLEATDDSDDTDDPADLPSARSVAFAPVKDALVDVGGAAGSSPAARRYPDVTEWAPPTTLIPAVTEPSLPQIRFQQALDRLDGRLDANPTE